MGIEICPSGVLLNGDYNDDLCQYSLRHYLCACSIISIPRKAKVVHLCLCVWCYWECYSSGFEVLSVGGKENEIMEQFKQMVE